MAVLDLEGGGSLAAAEPKKTPTFGHCLVRTKQRLQRLARRRGTGALQKRDQSFNIRSWAGGLRSLAAAEPKKDPNIRPLPGPDQTKPHRLARRRGTGRPPETTHHGFVEAFENSVHRNLRLIKLLAVAHG